MSRGRPWRLWPLDNDYHYPPMSRQIGVLRYDGDPDVFTAVVAPWLRSEGFDGPIEPPAPALWRWVPDPSCDFRLTDAHRRGPGVWLGSLIVLAHTGTGPVAEVYCSPCDACRGERHHTWCPYGRMLERKTAAA